MFLVIRFIAHVFYFFFLALTLFLYDCALRKAGVLMSGDSGILPPPLGGGKKEMHFKPYSVTGANELQTETSFPSIYDERIPDFPP